MKIYKRIVRQELGVALLEFKTGGRPNNPDTASYAVNSRHTLKISCFSDLESANSYFEDEIRHFQETLVFRSQLASAKRIRTISAPQLFC